MDSVLLRPGSRLWQRLFWGCVVGATTMALLPHPPRLVPMVRFADKFEHMIAFGVLTALAMLAFPALSRWRVLLCLSVFGAAIEVFQAIPDLHRDGDLIDWIVDTVVVAAVLAAPLLVRPRPAETKR